jgi:hypothetical protein
MEPGWRLRGAEGRESQPMVGKYYADYSAISREQLDAVQPELDELFKNSKVVSVKRDL